MKRIINKLALVKKKKLFSHKAYKTKIKLFNCLWIFHMCDRDDHPSVPHGHSSDKRYKLNPWNGKIYSAGNDRMTVIAKLSEKELAVLYEDKKFIEFAVKHIIWYQNTFPYIRLNIPGWFEEQYIKKRNAKKLRSTRKQILLLHRIINHIEGARNQRY